MVRLYTIKRTEYFSFPIYFDYNEVIYTWQPYIYIYIYILREILYIEIFKKEKGGRHWLIKDRRKDKIISGTSEHGGGGSRWEESAERS